MSKKISVILAVYNCDHFLKASIDSILNQDYKNIELIIINDGSSDGSKQILEEYAKNDHRVVLHTQKNSGLTKSLNKAIRLSTGEYIARQDGDDISDISRLKKQLNFLIENKLDFCVSKTTRFSKDAGIIDQRPNNNLISTRNAFSKKYLKYGNPYIHGTFFGKREVFENHMYDENFRTAQDYDLISRLALSGTVKMGFQDEVLYQLRISDGSITRSKGSTQVQNAKIIARKYYGTDFYLITSSGKIKRKMLSILKTMTCFI